MQLTTHLPQTDPAANLATGTPSKTRQDFFPRRRARQTPFLESVRECGCTKSQCRRFPSHACSLVGLAPLSSANKEQCLRNYERKKSRRLPHQSVLGGRSSLLNAVTTLPKQR